MADGKADTFSLVPGRACGDCSLCCKLIRVDAAAKAAGTWCTHCAPGRGCKIYDARPAECRDFYCAWMASPALGEEWRPSRCKLVLRVESDGRMIAVHVDPSDPAAWRREPYFQTLKRFAVTGANLNQQVIGPPRHDSAMTQQRRTRSSTLHILGPAEMRAHSEG
jgi:hypothetical protein